MKKNTIVQFVCFITNLEFEEFSAMWERYAKQFVAGSADMTLHEATAIKGRNKYKYVSQHESSSADFKFAFMKGRNSEHFPEHNARVVLAGGYRTVQLQCNHNETKDDVKVMAFVAHNERDLDFYHQQTYRHLNIYEAYYESCAYNYIMEFFIQESDAPALVEQLKTRPGIEVALYKECTVLHS
jgi:hypothetical protein